MLGTGERPRPLGLRKSGVSLAGVARSEVDRDRRPGRRADGESPRTAAPWVVPDLGRSDCQRDRPGGCGPRARETLVHGTPALSRRAFLKGSALLAASSGVLVAASRSLLAAEPGYNRYNNAYGDFATHIKEIERGGRNVAGSDYTFAHGIPVASPVGGKVRYVQDFKHGTAGKSVVIEYGIVDIQIAHLERLFVGRGESLDRSTCIGTQGKNAAAEGKAAVSHLHMSVFGCGAFYDYRQIQPGGSRSNAFFLLNPDRLIPDRNARSILTDRPWDGRTDYDTPYLDYVDAHVRRGLERLTRDFPNDRLAASIGRWLKSRSLAATLRRVWITHQQTRQPGSAFARRIESIFEHVRKAGELLMLTSPYIDHTNPQTILKVADANPEPARSLILDARFYGRFLPHRTAGAPVGRPPA